ncbi:MAG: DUF4065 domain-containing protein [Candidatus Saccharibacteria bacterium]|nr:DUF4065 domain-containing protein [Candidatus Saccharibacteria bacterium]
MTDMNNKSARSPIDVIRIFLALQEMDGDSGDVLTNLKAQKLAYYSQGVALAKLGKPLFDDDFVAWQHGPVIPDLYHKLRRFGASQIRNIGEADTSIFSKDELDVIVSVYKTFGQYSAWKLRDMTHSEAPWVNVNINDTITKKSIADYFKSVYSNASL